MNDRRKQYLLCQLSGWIGAYLIFSYMIARNPFASTLEYGYSAVLLASAALLSHLIRIVFKSYFAYRPTWQQICYFVCAVLVMTTLSTVLLIVAIFLFAHLGWSYPIPRSQWEFVIEKVFVSNAFNMLGLSLLWTTCYLTLTKVRQLHEARSLLQTSQLQLLNNQLNPHFLFNAINDLRALILEQPQQARKGLAQLSDILRYSLQPLEDDKVALASELECARNYLALCQFGLESRLSYKFEVDEQSLACLVPKLMLQMCLENAVKHGIAPSVEGGEVAVVVRINGENLEIQISNPYISQRSRRPSLGIGTKNIQNRLRLLYQGKASMVLTQQGTSMLANISLPKEYA
ncbi:sensor histidine kinase [Pseudoalteromonas sp. S16_S37]|uniref:sensor histidine kinase n=1 Tax=Pseudoalteromonas sp. S16_S37 TaxID=2720228 RepID=UPI00167FF0C1|nr:histidine kinase [Pseudoalteromonas sp. S16_S37]MBD1583301.1 histidine kinase [Pseudoalteromonas sp. S16_S37]